MDHSNLQENEDLSTAEEGIYHIPMPREDADTPDTDTQEGSESEVVEGAFSQREDGLQPESNDDVDAKQDGQDMITREYLTQASNELIDSLNVKRKKDAETLSDFKSDLDRVILKTFSQMETKICTLYEKKGKVIQDKVQELFDCLNRIAKIEEELLQFRESLQVFYQDVQK